MTTTDAQLDPARIEAASTHVLQIYGDTMVNYMIDIGHRTGLLAEIARGPGTSEEVASRSGLTERYVREWLATMVAGKVVEYEPTTSTYSLPPAYAAVLTEGPLPFAGFAQMQTLLAKHVHEVARAFREGGGVPYAAFRPEFTDVMDAISRTYFDLALVDGCLAMVPGLTEQLEAGATVADVCCGTGHALVVLGRRFPKSRFVGYDLDEGAIGRARAEAAGANLDNVTFHVADATRLDVRDTYDAAFVFDAIHDQVDPVGVLTAIHDALVPGGVLFAKEPTAADQLEDNIGNPFAPVLYGVSTLHCMTVSLAHEGAGIGTAMGQGLARRLFADAGFGDVEVAPAPGDEGDAVYITRKAG
jgi:SAM-dependent methyltransferase